MITHLKIVLLRKTLICLVGLGILLSPQTRANQPVVTSNPLPQYYSYAQLDLLTGNKLLPTRGSSSITNIDLVTASQTHLNLGMKLPIDFTVSVDRVTDLQVVLQSAYLSHGGVALPQTCAMKVSVTGSQSHAAKSFVIEDTDPHLSQLSFNIGKFYQNNETLNISLNKDPNSSHCWFYTTKITVMPRQVYSQNQQLNTALYAQFGETNTLNLTAPDQPVGIKNWTRGYGLADQALMIPAPTFYFKPGDLVSIELLNQLNIKNKLGLKTALRDFEDSEAANLNSSPDEILDNVDDKVKHEVNIPHNLNNTNLHVHGLHVDPEKDDVTLVIIPEDESDQAQYDAPHHVPKSLSELSSLNEASVADQSVKQGQWLYQYRIPALHLPGTHWFHPHKHGSTAAQLENGMAGSLVIQEQDNVNNVIPLPGKAGVDNRSKQTAYDLDNWRLHDDEVLMIQEIANYGLQQGRGTGVNKPAGGGINVKTPIITINGEHLPTRDLSVGQLKRWRLVNAGSNHQAFSQIWLGKRTDHQSCNIKDNTCLATYTSVAIHLVAVDGITLDQKVEITATNPLLLAPGNRGDVLIKLEDANADDNYTLFKYVPNNISVIDTRGNSVWRCAKTTSSSTNTCSGSLRMGNAPGTNPYLFAADGKGAIKTPPYANNYDGFQQSWKQEIPKTNTKVKTIKAEPLVVMPLLKVGKTDNNFLDIALAAQSHEFPSMVPHSASYHSGDLIANTIGKWAVQSGTGPKIAVGGTIVPTALLNIKIDHKTAGVYPLLPSDNHLQSIHLRDKQGNIPNYVKAVSDSDVLQSRPVIFDFSGAAISVTAANNPANSVIVAQFSLNGRPFALNDPIGNKKKAVNQRMQTAIGPSDADIKSVNIGKIKQPDQACLSERTNPTSKNIDCQLNIKENLSFVDKSTNWTNKVNGQYYWVNPSYYQGLLYDKQNNWFTYYNNIVSDEGYPKPNWELFSGISQEAIVNTTNPLASSLQQSKTIPGLPVSTSAEEWILINNSDIGHPFHIHINPFFVTEVGQLSYEAISGNNQVNYDWVIRATTLDGRYDQAPTQYPLDRLYKLDGNSSISHFVGNWWDTVIIPPHGYVKVRYRFNVPNQTGMRNDIQVEDNANKLGIWVYHCHILRHEDRGMMMPVVTQPMPELILNKYR